MTEGRPDLPGQPGIPSGRVPSRRNGRLVPVRLVDIPVRERLRAAKDEARYCRDGDEARELFVAALFPSGKTYWVRAA